MQKLYDLKSRLGLNANTASITPTSSDTSAQESHGRDNALPKYPIGKPTMRLFPETQTPLPTVKIAPRHSNSFNSKRATGMNKLEQLQFVDKIKQCIVDEASVMHERSAKYTTFKVTVVCKRSPCPVSPATFGDCVLHVAKLIAVDGPGLSNEWVLLEQSEETEYLADAVEDLWEKVMLKAGEMTEGMKVGRVLTDDGEKRPREKSLEL